MDISNSITETFENIVSIKESIKESPKKLKERECLELKNLENKNVLMHGNNLKPVENNINNIDVSKLEEILEKECLNNRLDLWSKLDKTDKINKFKEYANKQGEKYSLNETEITKLNTYLLYCLERKYFTKIKDINYNKETGIIENIPNLVFNNESRTFYIKKNEKHGNTLKSLAPKKNNRTHKF